MKSRFSGSCGLCGHRYLKGDQIKKLDWQWVHDDCPSSDQGPGSQRIKPKGTGRVRQIA